MASQQRNVKSPMGGAVGGAYEPMGKMPSNTLKRSPKMDLNKNDLLRLLSYLEGELQARDISIATLKAEKAKQLLYQAKYGRFGLGDPFHALQRDSDAQRDNSFDEAAVKAMYDNQLLQLEKLIDTQRKAQQRMREQLVAVEKRYHKVCAELEDEQRKHAQDTAQGDDVTYLLEKERERLKQELEFEKTQAKKMEKESKKAISTLEEEKNMSAKHKQVALMLIRDRKRLVERLLVLQARATQAESTLKEQEGKRKETDEHRAMQMEAAMERQLAEFDTEREQMRARLQREEGRSRELAAEVDRLKGLLESYQRGQASNVRVPAPTGKVFKNTPPNTPPESRKIGVSPERDTNIGAPLLPGQQQLAQKPAVNNSQDASSVKRAIMQFNSTPQSPSPERTLIGDKPGESMAGVPTTSSRMHITSSQSPVSAAQGGSTVFTTPSGTRISLNVGPVGSGNQPRKPSAPIGRGVPPPVPPNKPQVYIPPTVGSPSPTLGVQPGGLVAAPRKDFVRAPMPQHVSYPSPHSPAGYASQPQGAASPRPQTPTKFGITISKDKITISSPEGAINDNTRHMNTSNQRPVGMASGGERKTSHQWLDGDTSPSPSDYSSSSALNPSVDQSQSAESSPSLDIFGPEMDDLQHLLVSMVTDSREGTPPLTESPSKPLISPSSSSASPISSQVTFPSLQFLKPSLTDVDPAQFPLHLAAFTGDLQHLRNLLANSSPALDLNQPIDNGITAVYCAAANGHSACLSLLLEAGADATLCRIDHTSPLHVTVAEGHINCSQLLLHHGADACAQDYNQWTPLHWAAATGNTQCCSLLLERGARLDMTNNKSWTPMHIAIHAGHADCLKVLLTFSYNEEPLPIQTDQSLARVVEEVVSMVDKDGWTVVHLAATKPTKDCLELLHKICGKLDLNHTDKWNRSVLEIASDECRAYLEAIDTKQERLCTVHLELSDLPHSFHQQQNSSPSQSSKHTHVEPTYTVGSVRISPKTTWSELEEHLGNVVLTHFGEASVGLKTKKSGRTTDQDSPPDGSAPFNLGLTFDSIKYYSIGMHIWSPGTPSDLSPHTVLNHCQVRSIGVRLFGLEDGCQDSLSYETLIPVATLQNYLRLMEQYKNVVFYGPAGTGKTYLARRLAHCIQAKEQQNGNRSEIYPISLTGQVTRHDLHNLFIEKGCLLSSTTPVPVGSCPILLFDDLSKINMSEAFKDLLPAIENRGPMNVIRIKLAGRQDLDNCYIHPGCYIIGTMDRTRSTGLDLSIQQRFRWVHLRCDQEPIRTLLQRHLLRRLVHTHGGHGVVEDSVSKAVEWVILVWQRLNEGLTKLGLLDMVFGPTHFMSCPVQTGKPKAILRWLSLLWNHVIAPAVSEAVIKGSGTDTGSGGQKKVANTALYVLMQRAVVGGCPLTGQEKERYLSSFQGSNELDIKMRAEKREPAKSAIPLSSVTSSPSKQPPAATVSEAQHHLQSEQNMSSQTRAPVPTPRTSISQVHSSPRPNSLATNTQQRAISMATTVRSPPEGSESDEDMIDSMQSHGGQVFASDPDQIAEEQKGMSFGNTIFAVSGIPAFQSDVNRRSSAGVERCKAPVGGVQVIMTQPSRGSGPVPPSRAHDFGIMSRSFDGDLPGIHGRPSSAGSVDRRAMSPQPAQLAVLDPRRAMSPGPEFYSNKDDNRYAELMARRAISPGPELLLRNTGSLASRTPNVSQRTSLGLTGGMAPLTTGMPQNRTRTNKGGTPPAQVTMMTGTNPHQGKRADFIRSPQLVNTTKLQTFDGQNRPKS